MEGLNQVVLLGNLGDDPSVRVRDTDNTAFCNFSLATNERRKDKGEWVDHVEWHRVSVIGATATACGEYLRKGSPVLIQGRLQTKRYTDKEGVERWITSVVADKVRFLGTRQDRESGDQPREAPRRPPRATPNESKHVSERHQAAESRQVPGQKTGGHFDDMADDIPF